MQARGHTVPGFFCCVGYSFPEWDTGQGGAGVNGIDERGARNRGSGCIPGAREFAGIEISSQSCGTHVGELMVLAVHVSRGVERL